MQAVPLAKEQKDVLVNIILQLAEQSSQEIPTYEAATEEKLGLVKQAATVAEISGDTIKINIPSFDKQLVFDYNDIETFKQNILN